jgi:hypothetical protein
VVTVIRVNYSDNSAYLWTPFGSYFTGGASVALGDVNADGIKDIIVASGAGIPGMVRIWDGKTHVPIGTHRPLGGFAGGLSVAAGDVNGDGADDIVVGVAKGGSPVVTVISGATRRNLGQFMAYGTYYYGGITLGVGDVDDDGRADIAVGPVTSNRLVRIFDGSTLVPGHRPDLLVAPLAPFASTAAPGTNVRLGDVTGDGLADLVIGTAFGPARLRIYSGADLLQGGTAPTVTQTLWGYDGLGIRVALVEDVDGDNRLDFVLNKRGGARALRLLSSQLTPAGWPPEAFSWFMPMPGINSGIFVG